ncbi:HCNGP-domain-containing protein [Ceratobasidium sp. AG-I]|nr:HCNGP-domain-containing protein [Ceratobasidium sp. AG-I]
MAPVVPTIKPSEQTVSSTSGGTSDSKENGRSQPPVEPSLQDLSIGPSPLRKDNELAQIRTLLQPPSIPGVENFGIPPPSEDTVDSELAAKVAKFLALKKQGTHFNDILMRNKSFNNPHIYAKLVDFVDVDETGTNFPKNMWDPHDVQPEWYAEELGESTAQKKRSTEVAAAQAPGKRSRLAFSASAASSTSGMHPSALESREKSNSSRHADKHSSNRQTERSGLGQSHRNNGGRSDSGGSGNGSHRHHPYQRPPTQDTNMGWMPRNERSGRKW